MAASATAAAQPTPPAANCDVAPDAPLAVVTGSKPANLWKSSVPAMKFAVPAGHPVAIGKRSGDWTCVSHYGTGYGWMLTSALEPVQADPHPSVAAWTGTWTPLGWKRQPRNAVTKLVISAGSAPGMLKVDGKAYWFGAIVKGEHVMHEGGVEGEAQAGGNRLHIVDGGCDVNLSLAGEFLSVYDNGGCGGMNVTFAGVWEKSH